MVDNGETGHDQKRARLSRVWEHESREDSRRLPAIQTPPGHPGSTLAQHLPSFPQPQPPHIIDTARRHSEQSQYDPIDNRRPSSGHSPHAYQPPRPNAGLYSGPQHDAMVVKRDPDEQAQTMQFRPPQPITGNGQERNMGAPPLDRYPQNFEQPPVSAAPFRTGYPQASHSPMSATEPYNNHGFPPNPSTFSGVSYPSSNTIKRKATRAAQACDNCRTLKAKCDEGRPMCSSCKEKGSVCVYRDPPPKQQDKTAIDIMQTLDGFKSMFEGLQNSFEGFQNSMSAVQNDVNFLKSHLSARPERPSITDAESIVKEEEEEEKNSAPGDLAQSSLDNIATQGDTQSTAHMTPKPVEAEGGTDDEDAGPTVKPGPPSIPVNHTTGAARLLNVAPIKKLCEAVIKKRPRLKNENYPMLQEEKRGTLRLYGRGEGIDRPAGYEKEQHIDTRDAEGTPSDATSDSGSSPPGELWGQLGGLTPPPSDSTEYQASPGASYSQINYAPNIPRGTEIDAEGMPDLSRKTVKRLVESYMENMNIMHPILVQSQVDLLVESFLRSVPEKSSSKRSQPPAGTHAGFAGGGTSIRNADTSGIKRKQMGDPPNMPPEQKPGHPYRTITTGLVLMIMALGKICEHRDKIPEVLPDKFDKDTGTSRASSSPTIRNGVPRSPLQSSPILYSSTGLPSPQDREPMQSHSRRSSLDGVQTPSSSPRAKNAKNLDVIPGLSYFAMATDIIGNQLGGNSLQHVHLNILAGLYHGQLGRVLESHAYISQACRSLLVILRPKLDRFSRLKREWIPVKHEDNPLVFAFWTCLQLESDIVAELPCPHSGILQHEEHMPGPNLHDAKHKSHIGDYVLESYSAQLYLRKHLNQLHNMFYSPDSDANTAKHFATIEAVEESLRQTDMYAPNMKWNEDAPPASDILGARLRAKFYGARVITYRYFVLKLLEQSAATSAKSEEGIGGNFSGGFKGDISGLPDLDVEATLTGQIDVKGLEYAERCIKALIKSTTAFHGLGDPGKVRLLVTNIWGTAHAQWGNVMTLIAASRDPHLKNFISKAEVEDLYHKTVKFLSLHAHQSSALNLDLEILRHVGGEAGYAKSSNNPNSSFHSHTSEDVIMSGP